MGAMNQEDEQQYSKLRDKYAGMASNATVDPASYDDSKYQQLAVHQPPGGAVGSGSKPGDNVDVKLCAMCQGTGKQLEDYNNRRLERFCTPCNGKGVNIWKDGKEVSDPEPASTSARAPKAAHSPGSVCARLEADLASIDAKLKVYAEERAGVLVGAGTGEEGARLRSELVSQIDAQVGKLAKARGGRAARVAALRAAAGGVVA